LNNEESTARELLDNRSVLLQKIKNLDEEYEEQKNAEIEMTREIIDLKNAIQEYEILIEEDTNSLNNLLEDSNRLNTSNEKYENDIKIYNKKIDEILQKIELNSILKDIDIYELKNLIQNNSLVNHSLNNLMSKWDKAYSKLNDIEENEKKNNLK
jgi:translation initiation factor 2 beta subunit (eIF-2beta)/eIF-5